MSLLILCSIQWRNTARLVLNFMNQGIQVLILHPRMNFKDFLTRVAQLPVLQKFPKSFGLLATLYGYEWWWQAKNHLPFTVRCELPWE